MRTLALSLALTGCVVWQADEPPLVSEIVGTDGGRIEGPGIALEVPAGALGTATEISIRIVEPTMSRFELHAPIYRFEPDGLEFAMPVQVEIEAPGAPLGSVVMWTRPGESVFEFAGFVEDGIGVADITHFSDGTVGTPSPCPHPDGCAHDPTVPEDETCGEEGTGQNCNDSAACAGGDAAPEGACAADHSGCGEEPCRSACECQSATDGQRLCATNPRDESAEYKYATTDAVCPPTSELGETLLVNGVETTPDGYTMAGERNGASCEGYSIQQDYGVICACSTGTDYLCTRPWVTLTPGSGSVGCHTMLRDAASSDDAPVPGSAVDAAGLIAFVAAVQSPGETLDAASFNGNPCAGHWEEILPDGSERDGGVRRGRLVDCFVGLVGAHWRMDSGSYTGCRRFGFPEGAPGLGLSQDEQTRCRLTEDEAMALAQARSDCGLPARSTMPDEKRTLAMVRREGAPNVIGVNGRSGTNPDSSQARRAAAGGMCPPAQPRTFTDGSGMERRFRGAGPTHCHAEGDVLEQLAIERGREPPVGTPGEPWSTWGAVGGTETGVVELLVDRPPCELSCAPRGIDRMRQMAGYENVIVRSPSGSRQYGNGLRPEGIALD